MIRCQNCATDNLDGSEYCDECGSRLAVAAIQKSGAGSGHLPPQPPPPPPAFTRDSVIPKPATPYTAPPPAAVNPVPVPPAPPVPVLATPPPPRPQGNQTVALHAPGMNNLVSNAMGPGVRARLVIERGGRIGKEFGIINDESLIGRWDADGGIFPDVDLDQDDSEAKVSRRHARITCRNGQFFVEDLGSTNGTFVNRGQRLLSGTRHPLKNNDEIIVGKTFLRFFLV